MNRREVMATAMGVSYEEMQDAECQSKAGAPQIYIFGDDYFIVGSTADTKKLQHRTYHWRIWERSVYAQDVAQKANSKWYV